MRNKQTFIFLFIFALTSFSSFAQDKRVYRRFVLENQLKVLLVSDPDVNISSASMDVSVGALADPKNRQGMAHFVEHMLFLATKKYPTLNSYGEFLKSRGGYSNAFTASDHTNYHFQVSHEGLPEALDRFSQFFISPLLLQEYATREVHAVNSEHQKNIPQDNWRLTQLRRSLYRANHPANAFHTGNIETLKDISREELETFIKENYSPERMALCIISSKSLDTLEKLARSLFVEVKKSPVKPFNISQDVFQEKDCLRLVKVVPVRDSRNLKLYFSLPPQHEKFLNKTNRLFGMTMGDEGEGSLLSLLKEEGLATSLSAGLGNDTRFYSSFSVSVELTEKGFAEYEHVLELCFSYIEMLKKSEFPHHIWEEAKTMAKLEELYSPKGEGTDLAIQLASNSNQHGLALAEKIDYLFSEPDPENYFKILEKLNPNNMLLFLVGKGLETNQTDKYYTTPYSITEVRGELYQKLKSVRPHSKLHFPKNNPFIPKNIDVLPEQPVLLVSNEKATLWYAQDNEFGHPKVTLIFHILSPVAYSSPRNAALTSLYTAVIQEQLNEFSYPAMMAGLSYSLSATKKGVQLSISGYSESALKLLEVVSSNLREIKLSEKGFNTIYGKYLLGLKNFPLSASTTISREVSRNINLKIYHDPQEELAAIGNITLDDLKQYMNLLYDRNHIQALCCGNLTSKQVKKALKKLLRDVGSQPCDPHSVHNEEVLWLKSGSDVTYKETLPTPNSCFRMEYNLGIADFKTQAATSIMAQAFRNGFYTEMRTKQMLGYVVFSGSYQRDNIQNLFFIIQSGSFPSHELFKRADTYLTSLKGEFGKLSDEQFEAIRKSIIEDLEKKPKSVREKAAIYYNLAFEHDGDFLHTQKLIKALKETTKEEVIALFHKTMAPETRRRLTILLNAKQHEKDETPATFVDAAEFHKNQIFDK